MEYIYEIPDNLSAEVCNEMIKRFEKDDRKSIGKTGGGGGSKPNIAKVSTDLLLSKYDDWNDIDTILFKKLTEGLGQYKDHLREHAIHDGTVLSNTIDSGYQIQQTGRGGYYSWHNDSYLPEKRVITYLWYLNTIDPSLDGGSTVFQIGKTINPKQGKLLLFPATWTYTHAGMPYIGDNYKYICTGWICKDQRKPAFY